MISELPPGVYREIDLFDFQSEETKEKVTRKALQTIIRDQDKLDKKTYSYLKDIIEQYPRGSTNSRDPYDLLTPEQRETLARAIFDQNNPPTNQQKTSCF